MLVAPAMTWLLVTISPFWQMIVPVPAAWRAPAPPKNPGVAGPWAVMETTAGSTLAAMAGIDAPPASAGPGTTEVGRDALPAAWPEPAPYPAAAPAAAPTSADTTPTATHCRRERRDRVPPVSGRPTGGGAGHDAAAAAPHRPGAAPGPLPAPGAAVAGAPGTGSVAGWVPSRSSLTVAPLSCLSWLLATLRWCLPRPLVVARCLCLDRVAWSGRRHVRVPMRPGCTRPWRTAVRAGSRHDGPRAQRARGTVIGGSHAPVRSG